ncbi:MAG: hypothetical protein KIG68_09545 [Oxalobacter sp.]|nr:hypothetical protein [Oxalobacter sp.]
MILRKFLDFVNENIEFNERNAVKNKNDERRSESYSQRAGKFRELKTFLENLPDSAINPTNKQSSPIHLSPEDLKDLPDELLKELNISDSDKKDFIILDIINQFGGVASIDKILIEYFRRTNEIEKRTRMVSRLYRMSSKGLVYSAEGKGVYSTSPVNQKKGGEAAEE